MTSNPKYDLALKRIYLSRDETDGFRVLVDRLWPRGVLKREAHVDLWLKDIAPSTDLRKWFGHEPARFEAFRHRYVEELAGKRAVVTELRDLARHGHVTLLYAAHDETYNHARVLLDGLRAG